jgi:hypothetical protein
VAAEFDHPNKTSKANQKQIRNAIVSLHTTIFNPPGPARSLALLAKVFCEIWTLSGMRIKRNSAPCSHLRFLQTSPGTNSKLISAMSRMPINGWMSLKMEIKI